MIERQSKSFGSLWFRPRGRPRDYSSVWMFALVLVVSREKRGSNGMQLFRPLFTPFLPQFVPLLHFMRCNRISVLVLCSVGFRFRCDSFPIFCRIFFLPVRRSRDAYNARRWCSCITNVDTFLPFSNNSSSLCLCHLVHTCMCIGTFSFLYFIFWFFFIRMQLCADGSIRKFVSLWVGIMLHV